MNEENPQVVGKGILEISRHISGKLIDYLQKKFPSSPITMQKLFCEHLVVEILPQHTTQFLWDTFL